ncbi:MAG: IS21 family transposase [Candidatus Dojkabacteria bacterium]|jgi:transposase
MIGKEKWMQIRGLSNAEIEGLSISEIARQTGHDRKTVRKYLLSEEAPKYGSTPRISKLAPYKDYINFRLKEVPEITAQRILREIKEKGYQGSRSILGEYIKPLRDEQTQEAVMRFETMPGEQSQTDWSYFATIEECGVRRKLYCFSMVLGFSRVMYIEFTTSMDIFSFLDCHQNAFSYFGGYTREILYDNPKTVVIARCGSNIQWNAKFVEFSGFYGFKPRLCRLYRAQTKGKVERPFQYIWQDFYIGTRFDGIADLNQQAIDWLNNIANRRVHGTTREIPFERLPKENLLPLQDRRFDTCYVCARKASADCYISYKGNRYMVPPQYSRKTLTVRDDREKIRIYADGKQDPVFFYTLFKGRGKDIADPALQAEIKVNQRERWHSFKDSFIALAPSAPDYWEGFLSSAEMRGKWWELRKILSLCEKHSPEETDYAFKRALHYQAFGYKYIERILDNVKATREGGATQMSEILAGLISAKEIPEVEKRPLTEYDLFADL